MGEKTTLLIDEDPALYTDLATVLHEQRISLIIASTGRHALELCQVEPIAAIVLDLDMIDVNGLALCRTLHHNVGTLSPILAISSHGSEQDRLAGFDAGASDYVVKPVSVLELAARIRVHTSRESDHVRNLTCGPVQIDRMRKIVTISDIPVSLTATEYRLLEALVSHPNVLLTREQLISSVWAGHEPSNARVVDVCIRRIRSKLGLHRAASTIRSVRGFGYICAEDAGGPGQGRIRL